jgi:hypothetical protein
MRRFVKRIQEALGEISPAVICTPGNSKREMIRYFEKKKQRNFLHFSSFALAAAPVFALSFFSFYLGG